MCACPVWVAAGVDKRPSGPQELVELFFKSNEAARFREPWHRLTALPDAYNYKARRAWVNRVVGS